MIDLSFKLAPEEALDFWRDKIQLSPGVFSELSREAKIKAFAVSGIAKGDELNTVFTALEKSLKDGVPFAEFKKECAGIFEKRGWTGHRAWRVDNIFRTNIQTAYNTGRYQQMRETKESRPYWRYSAVNDTRTRPAHRAMHGKIFPADDPFWDTWYPPNGFRCRCSVNSVSQDNLEANGWKVETKDPTGGLYEPTDPVTGGKLPGRLLMPDYGWDFNPAKSALGGLEKKTAGKWLDMPGLKGPADYHRRILQNVRPAELSNLEAGALLPPGRDDLFYRDMFLKNYGEQTLLTDPTGEPVLLSLRLYTDKGPGDKEWKFAKAGHAELVPLIREMITDPYEIWLTPQASTIDGSVRLSKRYVTAWKTEDKARVGGLAVFEVVGGSFQGVTAFMPLEKPKGDMDMDYLERQRKGILLYKKR
jgi:SPP1 gp7 family putative phage head morphogenesis protein